MKCIDIVYNGLTDFTEKKLYSQIEYRDIMDPENFACYSDVDDSERLSYWNRFIYKMRCINDVRCVKILFFNEFNSNEVKPAKDYYVYDVKTGLLVYIVKIKDKLFISKKITDYILG